MTKQFKHPKLNIYATDGYTNEKGISTYYVKFDGRMGERYEENLLIALGFEEIVPEASHFGNGMIDGGDVVSINTGFTHGSRSRYTTDVSHGFDWSDFQTKEQAQQFDKMMMTVWKIWKWKRENDDIIHNCYYVLDYFSYRGKFRPNAFDGNSTYNFLLPVFSSREIVNQLISDLGEEELNNLLCWIYKGGT